VLSALASEGDHVVSGEGETAERAPTRLIGNITSMLTPSGLTLSVGSRRQRLDGIRNTASSANTDRKIGDGANLLFEFPHSRDGSSLSIFQDAKRVRRSLSGGGGTLKSVRF
jgi:hypothetical protein